MSSRSLVGLFFLVVALLSPWFVSDWFATEKRKADEQVCANQRAVVPVLANTAERSFRSIRRVQAPRVSSAPAPKPAASSKPMAIAKPVPPPETVAPPPPVRTPNRGLTRSIATGAKSLLRNQRGVEVPFSEKASRVASRHNERLDAELKSFGLNLGQPIYLRIFKEEKECEMWMKPRHRREYALFKVYTICASSGKIGPKKREGDLQVPEGFYFVTPNRMMPDHRYHMAFDLGYPNLYDQHHQRTGSHVRMHGGCSSISSLAMGDEDMEEIYTIAAAAMDNGQRFFRVHSFPFRMEDKRMDSRVAGYPGYRTFWGNLKLGYDFFGVMKYPPNVTVSSNGEYVFGAE